MSSIRYCISVYGTCGATQRARLQKLLNFGARVVSGRRKFDHISDVLKDLQWLSADNLWRFHSLTVLRRMLHTGQPESLRNSIVTRASVHNRSTRQANSLETPFIHTESGRRRFLYSAVSEYNALPETPRDLSPAQFRVQYRDHLLRTQYGDA